MKVLKFGGTSVGTPQRMKLIVDLLHTFKEPIIVVLSAVSGTTNVLLEIVNEIKGQNHEKVKSLISKLELSYESFFDELYEEEPSRVEAKSIVGSYFVELRRLSGLQFDGQLEKLIVILGELISTNLFHILVEEKSGKSVLLHSADFITLDESGEPDLNLIKTKLSFKLSSSPIHIVQGFICRNHDGGIDNLKRGGSDYTATLIGSALNVDEIQIWTDIDGMHNNDPRIVKKTKPISNLSFEEASELAYFGAKILHPNCIRPAQKNEIPVRIKNTMDPDAHGTLITAQQNDQAVKAVAAKDGITAIKIKSHRMILAYGFLRKVFEVFESYRTPIDMITTSEIAISLTIDDDSNLKEISEELRVFGKVEIDKNQTIICVVGDLVAEQKGFGAKIFEAISEIPVRMISYGGSRNNISCLVDTKFKKEALQSLNDHLFDF